MQHLRGQVAVEVGLRHPTQFDDWNRGVMRLVSAHQKGLPPWKLPPWKLPRLPPWLKLLLLKLLLLLRCCGLAAAASVSRLPITTSSPSFNPSITSASTR